jgi:tRNA1Val (adenine37-N6)-methyltransferase
MPISTDSVLLGAWVNVKGALHILDVGSGSGIISLMLAQRSEAIIDAVEIDRDSYLQCVENIYNSPWSNRIRAFNDSFQHFSSISQQKFDLIVSNPPFFQNDLKSPYSHKNISKHANELTFKQLILGVSQLLMPDGRLSVIIPYNSVLEFVRLATSHNLFLIKKTNIQNVEGNRCKRVLLTFALLPETYSEDSIVILQADKKSYSVEYINLTKDYYLYF